MGKHSTSDETAIPGCVVREYLSYHRKLHRAPGHSPFGDHLAERGGDGNTGLDSIDHTGDGLMIAREPDTCRKDEQTKKAAALSGRCSTGMASQRPALAETG
jgi:hypothetical protein